VDEPEHQRATRVAYDTVADEYEELLRHHLDDNPHDRAVLGLFADLVLAGGGGAVVDVGCGPGRITAPLHRLGLEISGIDLSPEMVTVARRTHPHLAFSVGSMGALDLDDRSVSGIVAWYSLIHTPPADRPATYRELARVLEPGGHLVTAFQVGDQVVHLDQAYGHEIDADVYRLSPDEVSDLLDRAGFEVTTRLVRAPEGIEKQPQAYLLARRR